MSYLVLARKYRPQVFEDIVGQDAVTRTLANAITAERVAHAYLFSGPRGVGKTTAARILAKALNCAEGPAPVPCNECSACREITEGRSLDVLEIDGASNRGINEVRELRENTRYTPTGGARKIYIIDEVHMLTNEAFNALLKTLEEPPAHVVFVLATTEPFKMPATILSRCQRFDFSRIPARTIADHLQKLVASEKIEVDPEALAVVARRARGGLRDALSMMDQALAAAEGAVDRAHVESVLGIVGADSTATLIDRMAAGDTAGVLRTLNDVYAAGADLGELTESLTESLRDLLLLATDPGLVDLVEAPPGETPRLTELASRFSRSTLAEMVERAAQAKVDVRRSEHPRLTLELAMVEMTEAAARVPLEDLARRLLELEHRLGGSAPAPSKPGKGTTAAAPRSRPAASAKPAAPAKSVAPAKPKASPAPPEPAAPASGPPAGDSRAAAHWQQCLDALKQTKMRLWGTFHETEAVGFAGGGDLVIRAPGNRGTFVAQALQEDDTRRILSGIRGELGLSGGVVMEGSEPEAAPAAEEKPGAKGKTAPKRPAPRKGGKKGKAEGDERSMGQVFKDEPMVKKAFDMFDGEMLP